MKIEKMLMKRKCKCGRNMIIPRKDRRNSEYQGDFCGHCKKYGFEESRRQFLEIMRKGERTTYK